MNSSSEEYSWPPLTVAFGLLYVWSVMSLAHAYDRRLTEATESYTDAFKMVGRLDVIADNLSHLGVDQQAFLSTGDERFQDGVIESIETLQLNIDVLNSLAAQSTSQGALLLELCRSIEEVIGNVGESDGIREVGSKAAAVAFFDSKEAEISQAISQTNQFRLKNMLSISDRVRSGRSGETLLAGFLADARRWQHAALSNSARQRERAGTAHHIRSHS